MTPPRLPRRSPDRGGAHPSRQPFDSSAQSHPERRARVTTEAGNPRDRVVPLGHATVCLDLAGTRFVTDPVLRPRVAFLERVVPNPEVPRDTDAVLISHLH